MDQRLGAWGRAVKARQARTGNTLPTLWLFTDAERMPDPLPAIRALPRGQCGVVFRHDGIPRRASLAGQVARICRDRNLPLTIAGDPRLAARLGAGVHLRAGRHPDLSGLQTRLITASAHTVAEIRRAARAGASAIFVSPLFATLSHPGAPTLGAFRFAALCQLHPGLFALGGIDGATARRLPRARCCGAGAIAALGVGNTPR